MSGCLVGATNFLFKQKRSLFDVIVELETSKIEIVNLDLRKQLHLSTEDLRFADAVLKSALTSGEHANGSKSDLEAGDEWIREQFKLYILHLMRASKCDGN